MDNDYDALLAESTRLELQVADLYRQFTTLFPQDAEFWAELMLEEVNHASIIRSLMEFYKPVGLIPAGLIAPVLQDLQDMNEKVRGLIEKYQHSCPARAETFSIAIALEQSAGELHFQKFMDSAVTSEIAGVFQRLNNGDMDHARRINLYALSRGIDPEASP